MRSIPAASAQMHRCVYFYLFIYLFYFIYLFVYLLMHFFIFLFYTDYSLLLLSFQNTLLFHSIIFLAFLLLYFGGNFFLICMIGHVLIIHCITLGNILFDLRQLELWKIQLSLSLVPTEHLYPCIRSFELSLNWF